MFRHDGGEYSRVAGKSSARSELWLAAAWESLENVTWLSQLVYASSNYSWHASFAAVLKHTQCIQDEPVWFASSFSLQCIKGLFRTNDTRQGSGYQPVVMSQRVQLFLLLDAPPRPPCSKYARAAVKHRLEQEVRMKRFKNQVHWFLYFFFINSPISLCKWT